MKTQALVTYDADTGEILVSTGWGLQPYAIPVERCASERQILSWVMHLLDKRWFTTDHVEPFIVLACEKAGIDCARLRDAG